MGEIWHRHLGIYGICRLDDCILLIHKAKGPYAGRYDLPGGSIEPNETIIETLHREFLEETGVTIAPIRSIGTKDVVYPWVRDGFAHTHCHHIAALYEVGYVSGEPGSAPGIDDSGGAEWVPLGRLHADNASPLVAEAVEWLRNGVLDWTTKRYETWAIIKAGKDG